MGDVSDRPPFSILVVVIAAGVVNIVVVDIIVDWVNPSLNPPKMFPFKSDHYRAIKTWPGRSRPLCFSMRIAPEMLSPAYATKKM